MQQQAGRAEVSKQGLEGKETRDWDLSRPLQHSHKVVSVGWALRGWARLVWAVAV